MEKTIAARHSQAYRERKKTQADRLGIEELKIETGRGVRDGMAAAAKAHGYSQVQELWQDLALAFLAVSPIEQAKRLQRPDAPAFRITPKLARHFEAASRAEVSRNQGD